MKDNIILVVTAMTPWLAVIGLTFGVVAYLERKRQ